MPPRAVTIEIRDTAQQKIKASAAVLAERFGIELPAPIGFDGRDPDFLRARELESIAGFMVALASAESPELSAIDSLTSQNGLLRDEVASLRAEWQDLKAKTQWFDEIVASMQTLLWTSVGNDALRESLESVGFIQSIYTEGKGWTVSVIGLGVDLDAIAADGHSLTGDDAPEIPEEMLNGDPATPSEPVDLSRMNRASLNEYATSLGIADVESFATKAELIAAIEALPK